jgi:AraC-like ligand binding domain
MVHRVEQHRSAIPGVEAMTLTSDRSFPRHSHDQLGIGVIFHGAHSSWSGVGQVEALAGDVIMVNRARCTMAYRWRAAYASGA